MIFVFGPVKPESNVMNDSKKLFCHAIPVPQVFHSVQKEAPFDRCLICNTMLLDEGVGYMIEKIHKGTEVIVEHAICLRCCLGKRDDLSRESCARIDRYLDQHIDMNRRRLEMLQTEQVDVESWISNCIVTGKHIDQVDEYQIYAHGDGEHLLFSGYPFMISAEAISQLQKLLSKKTRDFMNDFIGDYHGLPGEFIDNFDNSPMLLI